MYLTDACRAYRLWSAPAQIAQLEHWHPWLAERRTAAIESVTRTGSSSGAAQLLDLESVVRASQALSSHLVLGELSAALMKIIIANAGAQRPMIRTCASSRRDRSCVRR